MLELHGSYTLQKNDKILRTSTTKTVINVRLYTEKIKNHAMSSKVHYRVLVTFNRVRSAHKIEIWIFRLAYIHMKDTR